MRKIADYLLLGLTLFAASACNTTEDGHYPGYEPTDVISADVAEIRLNADGTPQEVGVRAISYWDASLSENENVFKISASTNRGDGTVTVSAEPNYGSSVKTSSLVLKARNFNKQVIVQIMQSSLTFEMPAKDYPIVGEEGGNVELAFNSTTEWEFTVRPNSSDPADVGSLDWFDFTPASSGVGDFYETKVTAAWKPNYTPSERVITLVLTPANQSVVEYLPAETRPQPFVLRQKAGTLPADISAVPVSVGYTDAGLTMAYSSKTPVEECGVRVTTLSGEVVSTAPADKPEGGYPLSGEVNVSVSGLQEGAVYSLVPFVRNKVGEAEGIPVEIKTNAHVVYEGVKIVDYTIVPSSNMVSVVVTVESDVNVFEGGISIYNDIYRDQPLVTYTVPTEGTNFIFEVSSVDFMTPNTDYEIEIFARTSLNEAVTDRIPYKTTGLTPDEGDMTTP